MLGPHGPNGEHKLGVAPILTQHKARLATDYVDEMIVYIQQLITNGTAYEIDGNVLEIYGNLWKCIEHLWKSMEMFGMEKKG